MASGQTLTYTGTIVDNSDTGDLADDQLIVGGSGTLVLAGVNSDIGETTVDASLEYLIGSGQMLTLAKTISGTGTLNIQGPGTAKVTSANSLGTSNLVDNASLELDFGSSGPVSLGSAISGTGSVTQARFGHGHRRRDEQLQRNDHHRSEHDAPGRKRRDRRQPGHRKRRRQRLARLRRSTGTQMLSNVSGTGGLRSPRAR